MFPHAAITCHNTIPWGDTGVSSEQQPRRSSLELNQSQVPFHAVELEDWMGPEKLPGLHHAVCQDQI